MATATVATVFVSTLFSWLLSAVAVAAEETCSYPTYAYNHYDEREEMMIGYKTCQWGCCWKFSDPCCAPPVGLIVGCVVGGFICLLVIVGGLCCCYCCCCRREEGGGRTIRGRMVVRYPHPHSHPGAASVHITSAAGSSSSVPGMNDPESALSTSLPPGVYQPPPSYEEVMAGEVNPAFKPDAYTPPQ